MPTLLLLVGLLLSGTLTARGEDTRDSQRRSGALGAFSRGDALSWDQLDVVATEAGISPAQITQMKIKDRARRLINRYHLPLEMAGFSAGMRPEEEFRLYKGARSGWGSLLFNSTFWNKNAGSFDNDAFLSYLLFRAEAYYHYRSRYDAEHLSWIVEEDSPAMQVLKATIEGSQAQWAPVDGPPTGRELEFRRSLSPSDDPSKALPALVDYALHAIAQKAADNWADARYRKETGITSAQVAGQIRRRDRALAADYNHARMAMTQAERVTFQQILKSPIRYTRQGTGASSEPVYDPDVSRP